MDAQEYEAWARFSMKNAGHWTVDPIHDGINRDLVAYVAQPDDTTQGFYVAVDKNGTWHLGKFQDGDVRGPCEGIMIPSKNGKAVDYSAALTHLIQTFGLSFLLALTHGVSPYRSI